MADLLHERDVHELVAFSSIPFLPEKMERVRKGVTPREIVYEEDRLKVFHYIGESEPKFKTPLCFVFALVNRRYIMDLKEGLSIVANYVKAGYFSRHERSARM